MPVPKVELAQKYLTIFQVVSRLALSRFQINLRIERGVLPKPTHVDENGVRYFDEEWIGMAKAMLK